jgi:hypothetical protein
MNMSNSVKPLNLNEFLNETEFYQDYMIYKVLFTFFVKGVKKRELFSTFSFSKKIFMKGDFSLI